jgi:hypothetical protein
VLGADRVKHLELIQTVIARLGNGSFLIKGWTLTIAAAIFALMANRLTWATGLVGLVPLIAFWALDGYFLWQERLFRCLYDDARKPDATVELMSMDTAAYQPLTTWRAATLSRTLALFYGGLVLIDLGLTVVMATMGDREPGGRDHARASRIETAAAASSAAGNEGAGRGQISPNSSSRQRGTRWTCRWNTVCEAAAPADEMTLSPSGRRASRRAAATRRTTSVNCWAPQESSAQTSTMWARGITNVCPSAAGFSGKNATASAVS